VRERERLTLVTLCLGTMPTPFANPEGIARGLAHPLGALAFEHTSSMRVYHRLCPSPTCTCPPYCFKSTSYIVPLPGDECPNLLRGRHTRRPSVNLHTTRASLAPLASGQSTRAACLAVHRAPSVAGLPPIKPALVKVGMPNGCA
jgi:hypothetical protein